MSKNVLIVEDNELNMKFFRDLLVAHGYTTLQTTDAREAFALVREHKPDLILMDIQLPEYSGLEVAQWIREDDSLQSTPIIAVTAHAMMRDAETTYSGGFEAFLTKPISGPRLLEAIEKVLG